MHLPSVPRAFVLAAGALLLGLSPAHALTRFTMNLDNGQLITVDNNSSRSQADVTNLVLAADRSTRTDCPYAAGLKGLFKTHNTNPMLRDRIFVNDTYLAWFDLTANDGFGTATGWHRGGALSGLWTLDQNPGGLFRYWKTGPNGCWNWPHNELIPGSASPTGGYYWWDRHAPVAEQSMLLGAGAATDPKSYFSFLYAARAANGAWTLAQDGAADAAGVHYKFTGYMASSNLNGTFNTDVTDGDDANGIAARVQTEVDWIARPNDIVAIWRFLAPPAGLNVLNANNWIWTSYSYEMDLYPACDAGGPGDDGWPPATYGQLLFVRSNRTLTASWGGTYSAGQIAELDQGTPCLDSNNTIYSSGGVPHGTYIQWGESSSLSASAPKFTFTVLGAPGTGTGTYNDPFRFPWESVMYASEQGDGALGGGVARFEPLMLQPNAWYVATFTLGTGDVQP